MITSRRQFLKAGTAVSITATLSFTPAGLALAQKSGPKGGQESAPLTRDDFDRCLSSQFQIILSNSSVLKVELVDVQAADTACHCCFSLVFKALDQTPLRQGAYRFKHSKLGTFSMFIVPGEDAAGLWYVAIFNRLHA